MNDCGLKTITLDGVEYVRKDSLSEPAAKLDGSSYGSGYGDG